MDLLKSDGKARHLSRSALVLAKDGCAGGR